MAISVRALFDGKVLRPERLVDLEPNTTYMITIEHEAPPAEIEIEEEPYPLTEIGRLAIDMGVTDLSTRHSWYAHGYDSGTPDERRDG